MAVILADRGPTVFVVTLAIIIVATVFLVLRLVSKWGVTRKANADDYAVIIGWVFAVGLSVSIMIGTHVGLGAPDSEIKPEWVTPLKQCVYAFTVLYNPAIMATKTAILILYYRFFSAYLFLRYASLFLMAIVNIAGVVLTFLYIFQCRPVEAAFSTTEGTCIDIIAVYLSSTPINILTDLAILLLPLPVLTSLRMQFREKVILVATFIVGGFVTIVDIVRIVYLQDALREELLVDPLASITSRPPDFTYYASFSLMWSAVEVSVGIMCCCVLVLKPLVMRVMPRLLYEPRASIDRHRPSSGTPESLFRSDGSKNPRSRSRSDDSSHLDNISPPQWIPQSATIPTAELRPTESRISPLSPRQPNGSVLPEPPAIVEGDDAGEDETLGFLEMLENDPGPRVSIPSDTFSPLLHIPARRRSTMQHSAGGSERRNTVQTHTDDSQAPTQTFFDFVQVKSRVPLTQLSAKEAWWPTLFVSTLFFLWGFAAGLIGSLSAQLQSLLGYPPSRTITIHAAISAYFFGPLLVGYWVLKLYGFKATFMTGLVIFATGAMSFWPTSVLRSYAGYFISNFIVFLGLSCLEVAADPYIALAGPGELSEARLNFAQGFYGIAYVVSPIIADAALFSGPGAGQADLFRVQWYYLAVALFAVCLTIVFYYVPLSEAGDDDLDSMALQRFYNASLDPGVKAFGIRARYLVLWSGVVSMWTYVGIQGIIDYFWTDIIRGINVHTGFDSLSVARAIFTFGRLVAAGLCFVGIPPRIVIGVCIVGAFITSLLALVLPSGNGPLAMLLLYHFFEGPVFPTLFAMIMRGQGRHTKFAATATIMTIGVGTIWPTIVYGFERLHPTDARAALLIITILFGLLTIWPTMISSRRVLRRWVDPKWSKPKVTANHGAPNEARNTTALNSHLETVPEG
ncbi:hypothetical protein JCM24511_05797 [Saitozyma sp. JCM 24511]|nr:hypothetical protein JCM24511_05797 [Saitozyma sp. JCM 24511]